MASKKALKLLADSYDQRQPGADGNGFHAALPDDWGSTDEPRTARVGLDGLLNPDAASASPRIKHSFARSNNARGRMRPCISLVLIALLCLLLPAAAAAKPFKLIGSSTDSGDYPFAIVYADAHHPQIMQAKIDGNPPQTYELDIDVTCWKGPKSRGDQIQGPISPGFIVKVEPTIKNADDCSLSASLIANNPGSVALRLYSKKR